MMEETEDREEIIERVAALAASVARTLTLGPSFTDDYRRYGPLQKTQTWV